jgi:hypothetical protein
MLGCFFWFHWQLRDTTVQSTPEANKGSDTLCLQAGREDAQCVRATHWQSSQETYLPALPLSATR